jgi:predicted amidohydrolase YtcJ
MTHTSQATTPEAVGEPPKLDPRVWTIYSRGRAPTAERLCALTISSTRIGLTGSLERGKLADLIALDRNLLRIPAGRIAGTRVLLTMVGGQVVYRSRKLR